LARPKTDVEDALQHLQQFYLVPAPTVVEDVVLFDLNRNTRALVLEKYGQSDEAARIKGALTSLGRRERDQGENAIIAAICRQARLLSHAGRFKDAEDLLLDLDARFPNRGQVFQQLGWLYKRWEP